MRKNNQKLLAILLLLLSAVLLFSACDKGNNPPAETVGETVGETEAPTEAPEQNTPAETEPETQAPAPVELGEEEALKYFNDAYNASEGANAYKTVMDMQMTMNGEDLGASKITEIVNGENLIAMQESDGMTSTMIILADKIYMEDTMEGVSIKSVVSVDAAQRAWIVKQAQGGNMDISDAPDQYEGVTGVKHNDGTVELTIKALGEDLMNSLMGALTEEGTTATVTLNSMKVTIGADGRLAAMSVDMVIAANAAEEGIELEMTFGIKASMTYDYENVTVAAPENTADYTEVSFDVYFGLVPDGDEAAASGLPLDKDSYVIGEEGSEISADDQYMMLFLYPIAYEDKTFTIYGIVGTDEELGIPVINAGEYGTFYFYCPAGVSAPVHGDSVKITATFENTVDKGYDNDFYCYTLMVSDCEVLAHGVGPNGGRIMFITASSLNVRTSSDTSTSDNILGTLSKGDTVEVFDQDAKGWWRIEFNGQTAYISNKYVSETRPE